MRIFINENTDDLIKDIRKYVKNTKNSQTTIDTLDLCHMLGKIEYLEEKKRRLEINVLVNDKEIERLNNIINKLEKWLEEQMDFYYSDYTIDEYNAYDYCYIKLKELKGE